MKLPDEWTREETAAFIGDVRRVDEVNVIQMRDGVLAVDVPQQVPFTEWVGHTVAELWPTSVERVELAAYPGYRAAYYEPGNVVFWAKAAE